jgi:hypothetical protein
MDASREMKSKLTKCPKRHNHRDSHLLSSIQHSKSVLREEHHTTAFTEHMPVAAEESVVAPAPNPWWSFAPHRIVDEGSRDKEKPT